MVVASVLSAADAAWDAGALALAAVLAAVLMLLIVFPSELFNATLDEHHDEIMAGVRRRFAWMPRRGPDVAAGRGWLGFLTITVVSALLYGLLDPGFGPNVASAVLLIGVVTGVAFGTVVVASTSGWFARSRFGRSDYYFRVLPATLVIAALCVAISRLVGFLPGYLYGLVGGLAFRKSLDDDDQGRTVLVSSSVVLVAAFAGWLAYGPVSARVESGSTSFGWLALEAVLAGTFIAGIEGLLFGLVPLKFLSGEKLFTWNKTAWVVLYSITAFLFLHLIARAAAPGVGATDWLRAGALFLGFGLASVAFWAYWRRRDRLAETSAEAGEGS